MVLTCRDVIQETQPTTYPQVRNSSWVSEGGLEHGNRCDLPGSGKSCSKGNTSRADESGYPAACSLFRPLPGPLTAGVACAGHLLWRCRPQPRGRPWLPPAMGMAAYTGRGPVREHPRRRGRQPGQGWLSWLVTAATLPLMPNSGRCLCTRLCTGVHNLP